MIRLTLSEIATAVSGTLAGADPDTVVTGSVEHDSRKVTSGGLFLAFPGEKVDGHDFAEVAVAAGAVAVIGTRALDVPTIIVEDPLVAVGALASYVVRRLPDLAIIGVTGSSGKTTTKDFLAQLFDELGPTVAPPGSFNNELGHPYTVLRADADTRYLVLEYSTRGIGHIDYLCQIAAPRIAVVLNVGTAHIGELGSVANIAVAKSELVRALPPGVDSEAGEIGSVPAGGLAVLNADDPLVRAMAADTKARVLLFGESADADIRAFDITVDDRGRPAFTLATPAGMAEVRLGVVGRHQVGNCLAVAAVGYACGLSPRRLAEILSGLRMASARRMDVIERRDGVAVIDDSYNANPSSMAAALRALASMSAGRRGWAVLGYMAELGDSELSGHLEVGRLVAELGVDRLVVVGGEAAAIADGAEEISGWEGDAMRVSDQAAAIAILADEIESGDVVLVKGSRYRTWQVADAMRDGEAVDAGVETVGEGGFA
ncbi:MAG: UDP-N-acetylmuramoyl-tripeptide--D-alanyl-D-alanine ligase [Longispora sp.]|nr:UDP-N-acetylmuramoyl-tripeptide--D-alanyl-D-alanine ligase [Longispora sp. (in: high G+C Gram-positive bacteria)]